MSLTWLAVAASLQAPAVRASQPEGEDDAARKPPAARWQPRAPIGIVDDFRMHRGEWMLSYRYERTQLDGLLVDDNRVDAATAIERGGYTSVPADMLIQKHHFSALFSPVDRVALSIVVPLIELDMWQVGAPPQHTSGIGDMTLAITTHFMENANQNLNVALGVGVPTGSVQENGPDGMRYPYLMQLGGGSWTLKPALTYGAVRGNASWGFRLGTELTLGRNSEGWRPGLMWGFSGWGGWNWTDWLHTSVRIAYAKWNNVNGNDPLLDRTTNPANDPYRYAGMRLDLGPGVDLRIPGLPGQRLAFEMVWPIYQSLQGPQLARDWTLTAGWQWAF